MFPHPIRTSPKWKLQFGANRPWRHALIVDIDAASTSSHIAMWKKPSASVLTSRPATVVTG